MTVASVLRRRYQSIVKGGLRWLSVSKDSQDATTTVRSTKRKPIRYTSHLPKSTIVYSEEPMASEQKINV